MKLSGRGLRCVRGGRDIFANLDFTVAAGETLAVVGPNGAGKSSLLRMIAGLLQIADGTISFEGGEQELTVAEQVHYLGHRDALKPSLTVLENLDFWRDFLGGGTAGSLSSLEAVGLAHAAHLPAAYLSAGQRKRLSIARLIAVKRPIWLLDEPTTALDTSGQAMIAGVMANHQHSGGLILAATHVELNATRQLRIGRAI
ncbi:heme exporter protein A [Nitrobacteraceae bacterium AZCC 1564]